MGMSASALSHETIDDRNVAAQEKITAWTQCHRQHGTGMISLKLRRFGDIVNHKLVGRQCTQLSLQVKKRKKIPLTKRRTLERPTASNQVWSTDFVCDHTAEDRSIKSLTMVDDATREAVPIVSERAMGGNELVCILDQLATTRGLSKAIRMDNGKEFRG